MTKLCPRGKAAAKRKFKVYPSAYANAYASKICAGKIKDPSGVKRKDFRGPKPAAKGAMMTAGSQSAMGRLQKARMMNKGGGADLKKDPTKPVNPFEKRRKQLSGGRALGKAAAKVVGRLGLAGAAAVAGATAVKKMMDKKKVDKKKMGGLKAELNNPAKGYMAGGMADYYKDLM